MWPFRRRHRDQELDDEIRAHLAMAEREAIERGEPAADARSHARRDFGNIPHVKEATRTVAGSPALDHLAQDLTRAAKRVARAPLPSAAAIAMLAVAIGLTTAMFSLLDALVLRPAPFPDADRLTSVMMFHSMNGGGTGRTAVSPAILRAWRAAPVFNVEAYTYAASVVGDAHPIMSDVAFVSPGLLPMLGGQPVAGRTFTADDVRDPANAPAVVSESIWRDLLGGSRDAIGARLAIDGKPVTIVGVLPDTFRFPSRETGVWIAADFTSEQQRIQQPDVVVMRLSRGVSPADAMRVATDRARAADASMIGWEARLRPVTGTTVSDFQQRAATLLAGGAVLVFLVLSANVASLLVVRFGNRRRELGVSSALGASRGRLLRQVFAETCVLGALGGVAGLALAVELLAAARRLLPASFFVGSLNPLTLDARALVVAGAAAIAATMLSGLVPAIIATRPSPAWSLTASERAGTESRRSRALMRALLIGEVAFACTLLVGAVVLVRSFKNLADADRGFDPRGLITVTVGNGQAIASDPVGQRAARASAEAAVRALPGVEQVAWSNGSPRRPGEIDFYNWRTDAPQSTPVFLQIQQYAVGEDFFAMYGIRLLEGRLFQPGDDPKDVVIGDRLAAALWPGVNPVGHSFSAMSDSGRDPNIRFTVIGVAKDVRSPSLDGMNDMLGLYVPMNTNGVYRVLNIKCGRTCPSESVIRTSLRAASPALQVFQVTRLEEAYADDLAQPRATALVSLSFSLIALLAAAAGLFSLLSYAVNRRRREFGIRVALGCAPAAIRTLVVRDGLTIALIGGALGAALAWVVVRLLASLEYGVTARDPLNWLIVLALIALAALAACWRPAARAMRVDPAALLRDE